MRNREVSSICLRKLLPRPTYFNRAWHKQQGKLCPFCLKLCILNFPHLFINPLFSGPRWKQLQEICSFMVFLKKYLITWSLFSIFPLSCYVLRNFGTDFSKLHLLDKIMLFSASTCLLRGGQSAAQPMALCRQLVNYIEILSKNNWDGWSFQIRYLMGHIFYTPLLENQTKTYPKEQAAVSQQILLFLLITYRYVGFSALCSKNKLTMRGIVGVFFLWYYYIASIID